MDKTKKYLTISFIVVLIAVIIISAVGMLLLKKKPVILQGQIESTEIRISGKLPGRIDTFLVKEGQHVKAGDTLVVINSPEAMAKYQQVNALEDIAKYQHQKIDEGTRKQIVASVLQLWNKSKSDLQLAKTTYDRIQAFIKIAWSPPSEKMKWKRFITQPWLTNALVMNNTRWLATVPGYKIRKAPVHWWQPPRVQSTR